MERMSHLIGAGLLTVIVAHSSVAAQSCDPAAFMIQDVTKIIWTDQVKTSFLLTATKEQYESARKAWGGGGSYDYLSGNFDYEKARNSALKESQLQHSTYSQDTHLNYLSQKLSPVAADMYGKCLEQDKERPGIQLWLHRREGDFFRLRAFWVGLDSVKGSGKPSPAVVQGLAVIQDQRQWPKGLTQELLVKKSPNDDGVLVLNISGQSKSYVLLKDAPQARFASTPVYGDSVQSLSGGSPSNDTCGQGRETIKQSCAQPKNGGYLVPGSITAYGSSKNGEDTGWKVTKDSAELACVEFRAATRACPTLVSIEGRAIALERFPAESQAKPTK